MLDGLEAGPNTQQHSKRHLSQPAAGGGGSTLQRPAVATGPGKRLFSNSSNATPGGPDAKRHKGTGSSDASPSLAQLQGEVKAYELQAGHFVQEVGALKAENEDIKKRMTTMEKAHTKVLLEAELLKKKIIEQDTAARVLAKEDAKHRAMENLWKQRAGDAKLAREAEKALKAKVAELEAQVAALQQQNAALSNMQKTWAKWQQQQQQREQAQREREREPKAQQKQQQKQQGAQQQERPQPRHAQQPPAQASPQQQPQQPQHKQKQTPQQQTQQQPPPQHPAPQHPQQQAYPGVQPGYDFNRQFQQYAHQFQFYHQRFQTFHQAYNQQQYQQPQQPYRQQQQQQQQQQQPPPEQEQQPSPEEVLQACLAQPPELDSSSAAKAIKAFLREAGVGPDMQGCAEKSELLKLAQDKQAAWEVRRVIRCYRFLDERSAPLAVFRFRSMAELQAAKLAGLKRAFNTLSLKVHPDKNHGDELAKGAFQHLTHAHDVLKAFLPA